MVYGVAQKNPGKFSFDVQYQNWYCKGYLRANNLHQAKKTARRFRKECAKFALGKGIDPGKIISITIFR